MESNSYSEFRNSSLEGELSGAQKEVRTTKEQLSQIEHHVQELQAERDSHENKLQQLEQRFMAAEGRVSTFCGGRTAAADRGSNSGGAEAVFCGGEGPTARDATR